MSVSADLAKRNQMLFEGLADANYKYRLVSDLYDETTARSDDAEQELKTARRRRGDQTTRQRLHIVAAYPALGW